MVCNTKQTKKSLSYFQIGGKALPLRLTAVLGGLDVEDDVIYFKDWEGKKGDTTFGTLPILKDGKVSVRQSDAILKYLGKCCGMYPTDKAYLIDEIITLLTDVDMKVDVTLPKAKHVGGLKLDMSYGERQQFREKLWSEGDLDTLLKYTEKCLEASPTGFMFGTAKPTIADVIVACKIVDYVFKNVIPSREACKVKFPSAIRLCEKIETDPGVVKYLESYKIQFPEDADLNAFVQSMYIDTNEDDTLKEKIGDKLDHVQDKVEGFFDKIVDKITGDKNDENEAVEVKAVIEG